jgi:hypothetical protein
LNRCAHCPGEASLGASMPSSMATMSTSRSRSARPGCGTVRDGDATSPPVLDQPLPESASCQPTAQRTLPLSDLARSS